MRVPPDSLGSACVVRNHMQPRWTYPFAPNGWGARKGRVRHVIVARKRIGNRTTHTVKPQSWRHAAAGGFVRLRWRKALERIPVREGACPKERAAEPASSDSAVSCSRLNHRIRSVCPYGLNHPSGRFTLYSDCLSLSASAP